MKAPHSLIAAVSLLLAATAAASPAETRRIEASWDRAVQNWSREMQLAAGPDARAALLAKRPDATPYARKVWQLIGPALGEVWTIEPASWFLRVTPGLLSSNPDGSTSPTFATEIAAIKKTVETRQIKSPAMIPMCMALVATQDPKVLGTLEKIQAQNPNPKIQGVAALGAAMMLKTLGDDPELMRKRLGYLRKAIIQSSDVELDGISVAKLAEDELYIIRYLTKGRVAPDISGIDSAGRSFKLSDYSGKVVVLLFWSSSLPEADHVIQITSEMQRKFDGKPFAVIGVDNDPMAKLRELEGSGAVNWRNFSDPVKKLAEEYRIGSWPLAYVLDGERKIHYSGPLGSFAELTASALLAESAK